MQAEERGVSHTITRDRSAYDDMAKMDTTASGCVVTQRTSTHTHTNAHTRSQTIHCGWSADIMGPDVGRGFFVWLAFTCTLVFVTTAVPPGHRLPEPGMEPSCDTDEGVGNFFFFFFLSRHVDFLLAAVHLWQLFCLKKKTPKKPKEFPPWRTWLFELSTALT